MKILQFHIHYKVPVGQHLRMAYHTQQGTMPLYLNMHTFDNEHWLATLPITDLTTFSYKYQLAAAANTLQPEFGEWRTLRGIADLPENQLFIHDFWRPYDSIENAFFAAAFKDVIFKRADVMPPTAPDTAVPSNTLTLRLHAAYLPTHQQFCVLGDVPMLGSWNESAPLLMSDADFPVWQISVPIADAIAVRYKYAIWDKEAKRIVHWEHGDDRSWHFQLPQAEGCRLVRTDEKFRYNYGGWRGSGVAIPVFSLRSKQGLGIGEFTDLRLMIDWATETGIKLVQTLPVNDTLATLTWTDSYPYAAISVFALHPLYINVAAMGTLKDKKLQAAYREQQTALNALSQIDFEAVLQQKFVFFKALFAEAKNQLANDDDFQKFMQHNAEWLPAYAVFCHLRDLHKTPNFNHWKKHSTFTPTLIDEFFDKKSKAYEEVLFYCYLQYHAYRQLLGATEYARSKGVVLKGDLPIGIYRYSCDAWVAPERYNMDEQAGAPPDAYAAAGQNWGFPTYNWAVMARDGFAWWRQRMTKLAEYFDALRIDHILGFFRIWQIPIDQVEGTLGLFNPRLPLTRDDLYAQGLWLNEERFVKPYIHKHFLRERFGADMEWAIEMFLLPKDNDQFDLKEEVNTQAKIKALFAEKYPDKERVKKGLYSLVGEVLFIEEPGSSGTQYNPRITLYTTQSYKDLDEFERYVIKRVYDDYFFKRHDAFWQQQAEWKLPALLNATNMLICGEDLGMIPNSVPAVMKELNIISLEIQRMPKGATTYGETANYPYASVCSPSCHDMSTIRGWWEGDYKNAQQFYNQVLRQHGIAPRECDTSIVQTIVHNHAQSPSMWAIFPLQDLVGMDATLRHPDSFAEQINEPSNPQHYWRYRFHIPLEDLLTAKDFNALVKLRVQRL